MKKNNDMKHLVLFITAIVFLFSSCESLKELTRFEMDFNQSITIPASTGINLPFNIFTPDIETNSESDFSANKTSKDLVEQIKLKTLKLTVKSPSDGDLGFLKSISVYLSADDLPEIKIAWKDSIPLSAGGTLELDVSDADMQEYIKKDSFKLKLNTVTREMLGSDYQIDLYTVFFVDVKVLGL
jgi:hypothetical protein